MVRFKHVLKNPTHICAPVVSADTDCDKVGVCNGILICLSDSFIAGCIAVLFVNMKLRGIEKIRIVTSGRKLIFKHIANLDCSETGRRKSGHALIFDYRVGNDVAVGTGNAVICRTIIFSHKISVILGYSVAKSAR